MNRKILCVLPLSFLVVACGGQQTQVAAPACVGRPAPPNQDCVNNRGQGTTPFVNVTPNGWVVAPRNVCVEAGDTLEIRFLGAAPALNSMGTAPKGDGAFWMLGANTSDETKIVLTVPAGPEPGEGFNYAIFSREAGCVDPRVTYN